MPESNEREKRRVLDVVARMRGSKPMSLSLAARSVGISPRAVLRSEMGQKVLFKERGRWKAKPWDRESRFMRFLDDDGVTEVEVRDSRTATRLARYGNAVIIYLRSGDERGLKEFRSRSFQSRGVRYDFITDTDVLDRLALIGEIGFEDLYGHSV